MVLAVSAANLDVRRTNTMNLYKLADTLFAVKEPIDNEGGFNYAFRHVCRVRYSGIISYIQYLQKRKEYLPVWKHLDADLQLKWVGFQEHDDIMVIERIRQNKEHEAIMKKWDQYTLEELTKSRLTTVEGDKPNALAP